MTLVVNIFAAIGMLTITGMLITIVILEHALRRK